MAAHLTANIHLPAGENVRVASTQCDLDVGRRYWMNVGPTTFFFASRTEMQTFGTKVLRAAFNPDVEQ